MFNILWITVAGFGAMWLLGLAPEDVFSLSRRPAPAAGRTPHTV
jgi:hypothetical protein